MWNWCEAVKREEKKEERCWCEYGCNNGLSSEAQHVRDILIEEEYVTVQVLVVLA